MNIAFLSTYPPQRCGIATYTDQLAMALGALGHKVTILAEQEPSAPMAQSTANAFLVWQRGRHFQARYGLGDVLKSVTQAPVKPDVVHVQHEFGLFPSADDLWSLLEGLTAAGIPNVVTLHTVLPPYRYSSFFVRAAAQAHRVIVHTPAAAAAFMTWPKATMPWIVPHGTRIETPHFDASSTTDFVTALCSGFVSASKGHDEILKALAGIQRTQLVIAGLCRDDNYHDKLLMWIREYGLEDRVALYLGFDDDDQRRMRFMKAHYVVLGAGKTTPYSASGQLATAIGCGRPVLAKNVPIYRDEGAILWNDASELRMLMHAATEEAWRLPIAERQRAIAMTRDWSKIAQTHLDIYRSVECK